MQSYKSTRTGGNAFHSENSSDTEQQEGMKWANRETLAGRATRPSSCSSSKTETSRRGYRFSWENKNIMHEQVRLVTRYDFSEIRSWAVEVE